jgi:AraC-like DNA-binding protein
MSETSASRQALLECIRQLLRRWRSGSALDLSPLTRLRVCRTLAFQSGPADAARQLLAQALAALQERNRTAGQLLQERYLEHLDVKQLARRFKVSEHHYYRLQNDALNQLVDLILEQERDAQVRHRLAVEARLEPPMYRQLFGVSQQQRELRAALEREDEPRIVSLEGMGGIGKTSLADSLVRELISSSRFYDMAWVSARQQTFVPSAGVQPARRPALDTPALVDALLSQLDGAGLSSLPPQQKLATLTGRFKSYPYLVVIDNLETLGDYQALLPALNDLVNPTKVLLTSRDSLHAYSGVFCVKVKELDRDDVFALIQHEAAARGLRALSDASQEQLESVYQVVGGNPLAIKLVIGQTFVLPLSQVLDNLRQAQGKPTDELYTFIYWQAWNKLSAAGRQALLAMPLAAPQGSAFPHLAAVSGLDAGELSEALDQLAAQSLVEVSGTLEERRYRIHRLTETFLITEVIKWQSSS